MFIYSYIRVSTDKQTVANQRHEIERYANARNTPIEKWVEETVSGTKHAKDRKLGKLLKRMQKGDILIVSELSRLGRNLLQIMSMLNFCMERDIKIIAIKEGYELGDNLNSKVLAFAFGLSAEIERNLISQRTKEALARKKAEGVILGRPQHSIEEGADMYDMDSAECLKNIILCLCEKLSLKQIRQEYARKQVPQERDDDTLTYRPNPNRRDNGEFDFGPDNGSGGSNGGKSSSKNDESKSTAKNKDNSDESNNKTKSNDIAKEQAKVFEALKKETRSFLKQEGLSEEEINAKLKDITLDGMTEIFEEYFDEKFGNLRDIVENSDYPLFASNGSFVGLMTSKSKDSRTSGDRYKELASKTKLTVSETKEIISTSMEFMAEFSDMIKEKTGKTLIFDSEDIRDMLLSTAIKESTLKPRPQDARIKDGKLVQGDGIGLFQIEKETFDDLMNKYLPNQQPELLKLIKFTFTPVGGELNHAQLGEDPFFSAVMARVRYYVEPTPMPKAGKIEAQAAYWFDYYNRGEAKFRDSEMAKFIAERKYFNKYGK